MDVNYIRHYDSLELQQMDDDTYETIEPKEEEDPLNILQSGKSMAVAEHSDTVKFQEEDDYVNCENETGTTVEMDVEGDYECLDIQNIDDATYEDLRTKKEKEPQNKIPQCDISQCKWVGVCVGLLCAILALLNVAVPLYLYQSNMVERNQLQARINNLTEERMLCESRGWQRFGRGCYYISTEKKNWTESRQWCRGRQSDLIVIKSRVKQDFVKRVDMRVWLGLTDSEREGSFQWVDGTPLTTPTYWRPGEPDNIGQWYIPNATEDCVEFNDGSPDGWNTLPCSYPLYWICEKVF